MTPSTACLAMYALSGMEAANGALWAALRDALAAEGFGGLPSVLAPPPLALPDAIVPETLFSQMCGYPLRRFYAGQYQLLGTPLYALPGCRMREDGLPTHCSFIILRTDDEAETLTDLRDRRFVMNGADSNSGMNLPRRLFAPMAKEGRFFSTVQISGSHMRSMEAVANGEADAASIDCVTYGFCTLYRRDLTDRLRILTETPASPAIPFISAAATPPATVTALTRLLTIPPVRVRAALAGLHINAVIPPRPEAYDAVLAYEHEAAALGYPELI